MTSRQDVTGIPPKWKVKAEDKILPLEGPSFEELCKPLSAKVTPMWLFANNDGWMKKGGNS